MVKVLSKRLHGTGRTCLVDVFGGSAAVTLHSGFRKRIYNDINGDLVNLFRVVGNVPLRMLLLKRLKWTLPSRQIFEEDREVFRLGGFSFKLVECPVERAAMTLYRHIFCFGGKTRTGGFAVSTKDRQKVKEVNKYHNVLRHLADYGRVFSQIVIENLDFADLIEKYGKKGNVVFFVDPPYPGFSAYYSDNLSNNRHRELAALLLKSPAAAICTFYEQKLVWALYPEVAWRYEVVEGRKNTIKGGTATAKELVLTKKEISQAQRDKISGSINPQKVMCFGGGE